MFLTCHVTSRDREGYVTLLVEAPHSLVQVELQRVYLLHDFIRLSD